MIEEKLTMPEYSDFSTNLGHCSPSEILVNKMIIGI